MADNEKQRKINAESWEQFEKSGDFNVLKNIRFIVSENVEKELINATDELVKA